MDKIGKTTIILPARKIFASKEEKKSYYQEVLKIMDTIDNPFYDYCDVQVAETKWHSIVSSIARNTYYEVLRENYRNVHFYFNEDTEVKIQQNKKTLERAFKCIDAGMFPCVHVRNEFKLPRKELYKKLIEFTKKISKYANKNLIEKLDKKIYKAIENNSESINIRLTYPAFSIIEYNLNRIFYVEIDFNNPKNENKITDDAAIDKFINTDFLNKYNSLQHSLCKGKTEALSEDDIRNFEKYKNKDVIFKDILEEMIVGRYNYLKRKINENTINESSSINKNGKSLTKAKLRVYKSKATKRNEKMLAERLQREEEIPRESLPIIWGVPPLIK